MPSRRLHRSTVTLVWTPGGGDHKTRPCNEEAVAMAEDLTVTREGDTLVIRLSINAPTPSASGKTLVVASTRGNQKTSLQIDGKDLYLGVNAYVYAEPKGEK
jgi:hypothetical protein